MHLFSQLWRVNVVTSGETEYFNLTDCTAVGGNWTLAGCLSQARWILPLGTTWPTESPQGLYGSQCHKAVCSNFLRNCSLPSWLALGNRGKRESTGDMRPCTLGSCPLPWLLHLSMVCTALLVLTSVPGCFLPYFISLSPLFLSSSSLLFFFLF